MFVVKRGAIRFALQNRCRMGSGTEKESAPWLKRNQSKKTKRNKPSRRKRKQLLPSANRVRRRDRHSPPRTLLHRQNVDRASHPNPRLSRAQPHRNQPRRDRQLPGLDRLERRDLRRAPDPRRHTDLMRRVVRDRPVQLRQGRMHRALPRQCPRRNPCRLRHRCPNRNPRPSSYLKT